MDQIPELDKTLSNPDIALVTLFGRNAWPPF